MSLPDFLKNKKDKKDKSDHPHHGQKGDFRQKIIALLEEIRGINEERYSELNRVFHGQYDKMNIQKKRLIGFYGQLVDELRRLRESAGMTLQQTTEKFVQKLPVKEAKAVVDNVVDKARGLMKKAPAKKKAAVKKPAAKKVAKAPAKKVVAAKKAPAKKKVVAKKAAPKAAKKK